MNIAHKIATLIAVASITLALAQQARAGIVIQPINPEVTDAGLLQESAREPNMTSANGKLYAVWRDGRRTESSVESDIYFAMSSDGGATWSQNRRVSDPDFVGFTDAPAISVAPDGSIWVVWGLDICYDLDGITCGGSSSVNNDVRIAVSRDEGATWTENRIFDGYAGDIGDNIGQVPQVYAYNDRVLALVHDPNWVGATLEGFDVYLVTQMTSPTSFKEVRLTSDQFRAKANSFGGPLLALAANGNIVCTAWEDERDRFSIYGSCSNDLGQSFPASTRWSINGDDVAPRLAFGPDGTLYFTYKDVDKKNIILRTSTDNGATWSEPKTALDVGLDYSFSYDLTIGPDGQLVMPVVMGDTSSASDTDLNVVTSIDRGQTFGITGPVEQGTEEFLGIATQSSVSVATTGPANNAKAHFVWKDDRRPATQNQEGIWSATASLDAIAPTVPANVRATGSDTSVLLEWNPSTDNNGVAYYDVYRATSANGPYTRANSRNIPQTFYRDVGLSAGTYFYRVVAVDGTANASDPSAPISGVATVGGALAETNGTLAYSIPTGGVGVRPLTAGVIGAEGIRTPASFPMYSTDGNNLFFVRDVSGNPTVVKGDRNGDNFAPFYVGDQPVYNIDMPTDNSYIAAIHNDVYNGNCIPIEPRVMGLNPRVQIAGVDNIAADAIAISPDHRWMAYSYRVYCDALATILYPTNRICLLDTTKVNTSTFCQASANVLGIDFGNTGNVFVFSADYSGQNEIWKASVADNGNLYNFVQLTRGPTGQPSTYPRVSSDGNWVAFLRDVDAGPGENLQVHIVRADGDKVRSLGINAKSVVWSGGGEGGPIIVGNVRTYLPMTAR